MLRSSSSFASFNSSSLPTNAAPSIDRASRTSTPNKLVLLSSPRITTKPLKKRHVVPSMLESSERRDSSSTHHLAAAATAAANLANAPSIRTGPPTPSRLAPSSPFDPLLSPMPSLYRKVPTKPAAAACHASTTTKNMELARELHSSSPSPRTTDVICTLKHCNFASKHPGNQYYQTLIVVESSSSSSSSKTTTNILANKKSCRYFDTVCTCTVATRTRLLYLPL
jgi:hypothetical protein